SSLFPYTTLFRSGPFLKLITDLHAKLGPHTFLRPSRNVEVGRFPIYAGWLARLRCAGSEANAFARAFMGVEIPVVERVDQPCLRKCRCGARDREDSGCTYAKEPSHLTSRNGKHSLTLVENI